MRSWWCYRKGCHASPFRRLSAPTQPSWGYSFLYSALLLRLWGKQTRWVPVWMVWVLVLEPLYYMGSIAPSWSQFVGEGGVTTPSPTSILQPRIDIPLPPGETGFVVQLRFQSPCGIRRKQPPADSTYVGFLPLPPSALFIPLLSEHFPNKLLAQKSPSQYGAFVPRWEKTMKGEHAHANKSSLNSYSPRESLSNCSLWNLDSRSDLSQSSINILFVLVLHQAQSITKNQAHYGAIHTLGSQAATLQAQRDPVRLQNSEALVPTRKYVGEVPDIRRLLGSAFSHVPMVAYPDFRLENATLSLLQDLRWSALSDWERGTVNKLCPWSPDSQTSDYSIQIQYSLLQRETKTLLQKKQAFTKSMKMMVENCSSHRKPLINLDLAELDQLTDKYPQMITL